MIFAYRKPKNECRVERELLNNGPSGVNWDSMDSNYVPRLGELWLPYKTFLLLIIIYFVV